MFLKDKLSSISTANYNRLFCGLLLVVIIGNGLYLWNTFKPADDYAIYIYFAEAAERGLSPYDIPDGYKSKIIQRFFPVGWTQPVAGVIRQGYADYPPLLMKINSMVFSLDPVKGLYYMYILLLVFCFILYAAYRGTFKQINTSAMSLPLYFLAFFGLNPIFISTWFHPIGDKIIFAFFILLLLLFRNKIYFFTVCSGLFASLKGVGLPIFFFYLAHLFFSQKKKLQELLGPILIFLTIAILSHIFYYPDWVNAYKWRAARQSWVGHSSLFLILSKHGLYLPWMAKSLTVLSFILLGFFIYKKRFSIEQVIVLPVVVAIIFNTEASFDRILIVIFAMLLISKNKHLFIFSHLMGLVVILSHKYINSSALSLQFVAWFCVWSWTAIVFIDSTNKGIRCTFNERLKIRKGI
jgi:hypothetical protein